MRESIVLNNGSSGLGSPKKLPIRILENEILWAESWKWEHSRHAPGRGSRFLILGEEAV